VPPENLQAVADAAARGVHIAIVTGRSFFFALPAVAELADPLTLIVHNGAITRARNGETLLRRLLPRDTALHVLDTTRPWRDAAVAIFDRPLARQMVYDTMDWEHPNRARFRDRNRQMLEQVESLDSAITEDPIQIAYNGSVDQMRRLRTRLETSRAAHGFSVALTEYAARDFALVDVCAPDTTKGSGLAAFARYLGLEAAEVMAVGDNYNDREMLDWAGTAVVMGNAAEDLRSAGFAVTGTNDEAGLAQAIRRFALSGYEA
jgi:Cof subfamily protein (haloacid dehalogenase superfamily)